MTSIALKHAVLKGEFRLDVDTEIPGSGVTGVFGESGSGKTTLLRCIAGLEGRLPGSAPVHERGIGYVHQQPTLFGHLSVRGNIQYGMRRNPGAAQSIEEVARRFEVDTLLDRAPGTLSGGEAQRVSIVRALCRNPKMILMDEPLSALDERRRGEVLPYLERLHMDSKVPIVYVSHNIDEICRLSDHLLVLDSGRLAASGELQQVLSRIDLPQLSGRNAGAVIEAEQLRYDEEFDLTAFGFSGGELWVTGRHEPGPARLRVRASDISLSREPASTSTILNILPAVIDATAAETTATELVRLRLGDDLLVARITRRSLQNLELVPGANVYVQIKSVTVRR